MAHKRFAFTVLLILLAALVAGVSALVQVVPGWQQVNSNGFGDPLAGEVSALASFNGFLYAGTYNPIDPGPQLDGAQILRSADGATWAPVTDPGFGSDHDTAPPAILAMTVYKGYLYAGTGRGNAAQIWRTADGVNWGKVVNAGFGDPDTVDFTALAVYDLGYDQALYVGATKQDSGAQIWRTLVGDGNLSNWSQVAPTVPMTDTASVTGLAVFDDVYDTGLYAAVSYAAGAPAQIWRSYGGDWETVLSDGFGDSQTMATGGMAVFAADLYVGAGNADSGAQLWRSSDGDNWVLATPAFGDANNEKVEQLFVFQNQLYIGVTNTVTGIEIWRTADGSLWEQANLDGFGDLNNTTTNGSNATADFLGQLYVGTSNVTAGGELWRMQETYSLGLSPDQALQGPAGQTVTYTLSLTNTGTMTDSINLSAGGQTWTTTLSTALVSLAPSASADFTVTVAIPPGAAGQESDTVTITATSQGDSSKTASAVLTTTAVAAPVYGVTLSADQSLSGPAGGQVIYTLTVTNSGNVVDTFDLLPTGNSWTTTLSSQVVTLGAGGSQVLTVTVLIPPAAAVLASDQVSIQATSQHDSSKQDTAVLTTTAVAAPVYGVTLSADQSLSGPAGGQVIYTLTVTNSGNVVDSFDLLPTGNSWTTTLSSQVVTLGAGGSQELTVTVLIPPAAAVLASDQVSIQATSQHDSSKQDTAVLTTVSSGQPAWNYLPVVLLNPAS